MELAEKSQVICHSEQSINFTSYDARWIPVSTKFIVLGSKPKGTGVLQIYEINKGKLLLMSDYEKPKPFKCGSFGASLLRDRHLATGDFEGKLQVWNLEDMSTPLYSAVGHKDMINCIDGVGGMSIGSGAPEIATGGRDGTVNVWDTRQKHTPVAVIEPAAGDSRRDCWCVAFGNSYNSEERVLAAGYDNGDIKMFNLKTMKIQFETNLKNGICGLEFDRKDIPMNKMVATTLESKFYLFDLKCLDKTKSYPFLKENAHKATVWCVKHLPQNREVFMTTGGDGTVNLWKYNYPSKRIVDGVGQMGNMTFLQSCLLSSQPVTSWDWSPDKLGLAVATALDQTVRVVITTKLNLL